MKSILFVATFPPPITGEAVCTNYYYQLVQDHALVDRVNISHGASAPRERGKFAWSRVLQLLASYREAGRKLRIVKPQILYFVPGATLLGQIKDWLLLISAKRYPDLQLVCHIHNGNFPLIFKRPFVGPISRQLYQHVNRFILLNRHAQTTIQDLFPGNTCHIVANTIDQNIAFTEDDVNQKVHQRQHRTCWKIYYVSSMTLEKGYQDLLDAAKLLKTAGDITFELHFIGAWTDDSARKAFLEDTESHFTNSEVYLHGSIFNRTILRQHLAEADILALPTYYSREAQPMCLIEAANAATALISTRHAGIPEILLEGENGLMVNPRQPGEIYKAILEISLPGRWETLARNSRRVFLERYSVTENKKRFLAAVDCGGLDT